MPQAEAARNPRGDDIDRIKRIQREIVAEGERLEARYPVLARRDHGGVALRLEARVVGAGDDAIGSNGADFRIELLDDQRHRSRVRAHRREQRDERSQPAREDER